MCKIQACSNQFLESKNLVVSLFAHDVFFNTPTTRTSIRMLLKCMTILPSHGALIFRL